MAQVVTFNYTIITNITAGQEDIPWADRSLGYSGRHLCSREKETQKRRKECYTSCGKSSPFT